MCKIKTYTNDINCLIPALRDVVNEAINHYKTLIVSQTLRSKQYQEYLYYVGRNQKKAFDIGQSLGIPKSYLEKNRYKLTYTMNSRHLIGCAVDLYFIDGGRIINDVNLYKMLYDFLKRRLSSISWGGNYRDWGHFEIIMSNEIFKKALLFIDKNGYDFNAIQKIVFAIDK